jgi:hypothetical protein
MRFALSTLPTISTISEVMDICRREPGHNQQRQKHDPNPLDTYMFLSLYMNLSPITQLNKGPILLELQGVRKAEYRAREKTYVEDFREHPHIFPDVLRQHCAVDSSIDHVYHCRCRVLGDNGSWKGFEREYACPKANASLRDIECGR